MNKYMDRKKKLNVLARDISTIFRGLKSQCGQNIFIVIGMYQQSQSLAIIIAIHKKYHYKSDIFIKNPALFRTKKQ